MRVEQIHHVAYRCMDSQRTAEFYKRILGMDLIGAIAENQVPSTREPDTYMNIFLDSGKGCILAFFEVPHSPPMQPDPNTPSWLQHIAFQVASLEELHEVRECVAAEGIAVIGPVDHSIFQSIYFSDPDGHRLEVAVWTGRDHMAKLREAAAQSLTEWSATKQPSPRTSWVHQQEFSAGRVR